MRLKGGADWGFATCKDKDQGFVRQASGSAAVSAPGPDLTVVHKPLDKGKTSPL